MENYECLNTDCECYNESELNNCGILNNIIGCECRYDFNITSKEEYKKALKNIEPLIVKDPDINTEDHIKLNKMVAAIQKYESKSQPTVR